ncbi:MAG: hypothetical protein JW932_12680 [Deltaproteobacteria bacterium]|nr:hypothetical protein [Deltaproteobacteria bacterium]
MKPYRLFVQGKNFLIKKNSKVMRYGFTQNMFVEADSPSQAKLIAIATTKLDKELKEITLNSESDPPQINVETFWELDVLDDISDIDTNRNFFVEKRWWQFWR